MNKIYCHFNKIFLIFKAECLPPYMWLCVCVQEIELLTFGSVMKVFVSWLLTFEEERHASVIMIKPNEINKIRKIKKIV